MIMRMIPLVVLVAGIYKGADRIKPLLQTGNVMQAQVELQGISRLVTAEIVSGNPIEPRNFSEYLKKNLVLQNNDFQKDTSKDPWGIAYQLRYEKTRAVIRSAGPDRQYGTPDDLQTSVRLD